MTNPVSLSSSLSIQQDSLMKGTHKEINTNVPDTVIIKIFILAPLVSPIVMIKTPSINNF